MTVEGLEHRRLLSATLVKDIRPLIQGADTSPIIDAAGKAFFVVARTAGTTGNDLYESDGTAAGTSLVRTYSGGSFGPQSLTPSGGLAYFVVNLATRQVWRSDGTPAGTFPVTSFTYDGTSVSNLTDVNGTLFFTADRGNNFIELWKTDGTVNGTALVSTVTTSFPSTNAPANLTNVNGTLYFTAGETTDGIELWKSDGTTAGTAVVKDIRPGSGSSNPRNLTNVNGTLYFTADDGTGGEELWRTDGTAAGTVRVKDIVPGAGASQPRLLTAMNGAFYFVATSPADPATGNADVELWRSDGTDAGTTVVRDLYPGPTGSQPSDLRAFHGELYFSAFTPSTDPSNPSAPPARQMWETDGTAAGTTPVAAANPALAAGVLTTFTQAGGLLYFSRTLPGGTAANELWRTDGTAAGTVQIHSPDAPTPASFAAVGGTLFYTAADANGGKPIYRTDGTDAGTAQLLRVIQLAYSSDPAPGAGLHGDLYFSVSGELWRSDGTDAGTVDTGVAGDVPVRSGSGLYFTHELSGSATGSLSRTDGSASGTAVLVPAGVNPKSLVDINGTLYFTTTAAAGQAGLWRTDGTPAGTVFLKALASVYGLSAMGATGGFAYFYGDDGANGSELWRTDGTPAGTTLVKDVRPGSLGSYSAIPAAAASPFAALGRVFFIADDGTHGPEVWVSDGTAAGTALLKDINPGAAAGAVRDYTSKYGVFGLINGRVVFAGAQGPANTQGTNGLWSTDGTSAGTVKLADHNGLGFIPYGFTAAAGTLFFASWNGTNGYELWRTDGTAAGTSLLRNITPGINTPELGITNFTSANGRLYFVGGYNDFRYLWSSDGTVAGTAPVDTSVSLNNANGVTVTAVDGTVFFPGFDPAHGNELWLVPAPAAPTAPASLAATVLTGGEVALNWADASGNESGFRIDRSTNPNFATIQATATVTGDVTSYEDDGLLPNVTYYWRVRAYNSAGLSDAATATATTTGVPVRPSNFTATPVAATTIRLAWADNSNNETGFRIERSTDPAFGTVDLSVSLPANTTSYDDAAAVNAATYYYRVRAFNAAGESPNRVASAATPLAPAAPTGLTAVAESGGEILLTWTDNANNETGYVVDRSRSASFDTIEATASLDAQATAAHINELDPNVTYYFRLRAVNGVSASAAAYATAATQNAPKAPTNVFLFAYSGTRVDLSWTDAATDETGYVVERSLSPTFDTAAAFNLPAGATAYSDVTAAPLTTYYYRVYAVNAGGVSGRQTLAVVTPDLPPTGLDAWGVSASRIDLRWTNNATQATSTRVERSVAGGPFGAVATLPANATSYSDTNLPANTAYVYRVVAVGPGTAASRSDPITARTLAPTLTTFVTDPPPVRTPAPSSPSAVVTSGGIGYFVAYDDAHGHELWRTDGTAGGTRMVVDLEPGGSDSHITNLTDVNGTLYFVANTQFGGKGIFKSDGTAAGTVFVKDTYPGANLTVHDLVSYHGALYFRANGPGTGDDLWRSDGTAAGTTVVADFPNDGANAVYNEMVAGNGSLYFAVDSGVYVSDGTAAGTRLLTPTGPLAPVEPANLTPAAGGVVYFTAFQGNGSQGTPYQVWRSDGTTPEAATPVPNAPAVQFTSSLNPFAAGGTLYFDSYNIPAASYELWRTDGTAAGTQRLIAQLATGAYPTAFTALPDGRVLFSTGDNLWTTDGTPAGTVVLTPTSGGAFAGVSEIATIGGREYFAATDPVEQWVLYSTDGTAAGARRAAAFTGQPTGLSAYTGIAGASRVLFAAPDAAVGTELWASDGTPAGTEVVADINTGPQSAHPDWLTPSAAAGGGLFYTAAGTDNNSRELYWTDGTPAGTRLLKEYGASNLFDANGTLYFAGFTSTAGWELWKSDGTVAGTSQVADVVPGAASSNPRPLGVVGGKLLFGVPGADAQSLQLWVTDGTAAGTTPVGSPAQLHLYTDAAHQGPAYAVWGGALYFAGGGGGSAAGYDIWRTDGTAAGTYRVKDLDPGYDATNPFDFVATAPPTGGGAGSLFFVATDQAHGYALWKTDGTDAGTVLVRDTDPTGTAAPLGQLAAAGSTLYFSGYTPETGQELWKSDGTTAGTGIVADLYPGTTGIFPTKITAAGGLVYFAGQRNGEELFATDGTAAGTRSVRAVGGSPPLFMGAADGLLFYADAATGQLWRSDGTTRGTVIVAALSPVSYSNTPPQFAGAAVAAAGDRVYYSAHVGNNVRELRYASATPPAAPTGVAEQPGVVKWVDNSTTEAGFVVDRSTTPDFAAVDESAFVAANATTFTDAGAAGGTTYYYRVQAVNAAGASAFSTAVAAGATVQSVAVNDGSAQRSKVTSLTVTLSQAVALDSTAFTLVGRNGAGAGTVVSAANLSGDGRTWVLTFSGAAVVAGSLADGVYDLTVIGSKVHAGSASGPAMAADYRAAPFHRLFGDADGDGDADALDLFQFRGTLNKHPGDAGYLSYLDYNGDHTVDALDLFQVRSRLPVTYKGY